MPHAHTSSVSSLHHYDLLYLNRCMMPHWYYWLVLVQGRTEKEVRINLRRLAGRCRHVDWCLSGSAAHIRITLS